MPIILAIPADNQGNKLWIKSLRTDGDQSFVQFKSTYNDVGWREAGLYPADGGVNIVITGDDGTVLFRFNKLWIDKLK
jgi:hypothetical protein